MLNKAPALVFYDFMAEIKREYNVIYSNKAGFAISVEQMKNNDYYLNEYNLNVSKLMEVNFNKLKLKEILEIDDKIGQKSYMIK